VQSTEISYVIGPIPAKLEAILAKQLELKGKTYWILSEPDGPGWRASVTEVKADGSQEPVGLDATAETRTAADEAVERKLRRMLQAY